MLGRAGIEMRIWHWQALKECKIKQKPNPPNCCDNCYLPHFLASFWRQTRFSTLLRQVLTWWWILPIDLKYLYTLKVCNWCLKLLIGLKYLWTLKVVHWNVRPDIQQGWHGPPPPVVTKTLQPGKMQELWILSYATLCWSGQDDASHILHAVLLNHPLLQNQCQV